MKIYFSNYFGVSQEILDDYGAFNISLISDLPLFIDPFLLFNSSKPEYKELHESIIRYLSFLKRKSVLGNVDQGLIDAWYRFPEVSQNWFGFTTGGNRGSGLGKKFAGALNDNLYRLFGNFGTETVTRSSHLEKLCLIKEGVGRDNISDFTTNLIKDYLLKYTQEFAKKYISPELRQVFTVDKVHFNYTTETWDRGTFDLPAHRGDFVILTPREILTKDDTWINKDDLVKNFERIPNAIPDLQLRAQVNNYFSSRLPVDFKKADEQKAAYDTVRQFPQLIDYFIKYKEDNGDQAVNISSEKVAFSHEIYVAQFGALSEQLNRETDFYKIGGDTYEESMKRVQFLKDVIENRDGYKIFYFNEQPIRKEDDVHILYSLTWFATPSDMNREVNNGRGPVDFKVSRGAKDKSLIEFKLASNPQLKRNLANQVEIYEKANDTKKSIKVIIYFTAEELSKTTGILNELGMPGKENIVLIDARKDNKPSASKA